MKGPWWVLSALGLLALAAVVWLIVELRTCGASLEILP